MLLDGDWWNALPFLSSLPSLQLYYLSLDVVLSTTLHWLDYSLSISLSFSLSLFLQENKRVSRIISLLLYVCLAVTCNCDYRFWYLRRCCIKQAPFIPSPLLYITLLFSTDFFSVCVCVNERMKLLSSSSSYLHTTNWRSSSKEAHSIKVKDWGSSILVVSCVSCRIGYSRRRSHYTFAYVS